MPNNDINQRMPSSINDLQNLYDRMSEKGGDQHIRGNVRGIYARSGKPPKSPGPFDRRSYNDARSQIRSIISKHLGSEKKGNQILKDVLGNSRGINAAQFGRILKQTRLSAAQAEINRLKYLNPEQAEELKQKIEHLGSRYSDWSPEIRRVIRQAAVRDSSPEHVDFLADVEKYNLRFAAWEKSANRQGVFLNDQGNLVDGRGTPVDLNKQSKLKKELQNIGEEAKRIRSKYVEKSAEKAYSLDSKQKYQGRSINIDSRMRSALMKYGLKKAGELKNVFGPAEGAIISLMKNDLVNRLSRDIGSAYHDVSGGKLGYKSLTSVSQEMQPDDHLRFENNRLYRKSSHPGVDSPRFFNLNHSKVTRFSRGRRAKFTAAKRLVQATITEHLKVSGIKDYQAVAKQIMQPYSKNSDTALKKSDLAQIVSAVDRRVSSQEAISRTLSQQSKPLPLLNKLVQRDPMQRNTWAAAFKRHVGGGEQNDVYKCFALTTLLDKIQLRNREEVIRIAKKWANASFRMPKSFRTELQKIVDSPEKATNFKNLQNEALKYRMELTKSLQSEYDEFEQIVKQVKGRQPEEESTNLV